jgi:hypothetical protein
MFEVRMLYKYCPEITQGYGGQPPSKQVERMSKELYESRLQVYFASYALPRRVAACNLRNLWHEGGVRIGVCSSLSADYLDAAEASAVASSRPITGGSRSRQAGPSPERTKRGPVSGVGRREKEDARSGRAEKVWPATRPAAIRTLPAEFFLGSCLPVQRGWIHELWVYGCQKRVLWSVSWLIVSVISQNRTQGFVK